MLYSYWQSCEHSWGRGNASARHPDDPGSSPWSYTNSTFIYSLWLLPCFWLASVPTLSNREDFTVLTLHCQYSTSVLYFRTLAWWVLDTAPVISSRPRLWLWGSLCKHCSLVVLLSKSNYTLTAQRAGATYKLQFISVQMLTCFFFSQRVRGLKL